MNTDSHWSKQEACFACVTCNNYGSFLFLSYGPLIVFMLILYNLHSCNAISHSEFSQDDVSGTRMNVSPF